MASANDDDYVTPLCLCCLEKRRALFQALLESDSRLANLCGRVVKFAFTSTDGLTEHMWVRVVSHRGNKLVGVLMSKPIHNHGGLKINSRVKCDVRTASDMICE
jgi:uncharacterized protein YegJ (DUF2314 family)